jgi:hypothetical protein
LRLAVWIAGSIGIRGDQNYLPCHSPALGSNVWLAREAISQVFLGIALVGQNDPIACSPGEALFSWLSATRVCSKSAQNGL